MTAFAQAAVEVVREYAFTKGPLGLPKLFAKILLLLPRQRLHRRWLGVLRGPTTGRLLATRPRMAFRHSSNYLFLGLSWRDSVALLSAHYRFINQSLDASTFDRIIGASGEPLWDRTVSGRRLAITLRGPEEHREGELNLCFVIDDVRVARIAFSIVSTSFAAWLDNGTDDGRHLIYIGHVQGIPGRFDLIRDATRLCSDIAPNDLLMSALSGIAQTLLIDRFMTAGTKRHLSVGKMPESSFDYAGFWARYGGTLEAEGHYVIDLPYPHKPLVRIVTRHRKRTSRKRAFKQEVCDAAASSMFANTSAAGSRVRLPSGPRSI